MTKQENNEFDNASAQRKRFLRLKEEEETETYRKSLMTWSQFWAADGPGS